MSTAPTPPSSPDGIPLSEFRPRREVRLPETTVLRSTVPSVDIHNHLGRWLTDDGGWMTPDVDDLLAVLDRCNVAHVVNLDGRCDRDLVENLDRYDRAHPDRFTTFCQLDFALLAEPDATHRLVDQLRRGVAEGARGLKVWKDLGLTHRDADGELVLPDDPRVAPVFEAAGELGIPVLIHTADPIAFFAPIDATNERIDDLIVHPDWWFGGDGMPTFDRLIDALEAVIAAHPGVAFIGAHVGGAAEDLGRVSRMLGAYPHYTVDIGERMAELGRQPRAARALVVDHPDQVLFGTDLYPIVETEYQRWFRFIETADECFAHGPDDGTVGHGRWDVSALDIPADLLPALYAGNARRILGLPG